MNTPPIFAICKADPEVTALLGTDITRLFMFGMAPQGVQTPYAVWQVVSGNPENYISCRPDTDSYTLQIDAYANTAETARQVAGAIRNAIEDHCHVVSYRGESRDTETMNYRSSFDVDWIVNR